MKAMILAAGLGTRLRPLTHLVPKPLIPVDGLPLIFYNLGLLKKFGISDVVINLYHLGHQIKDLLGSGERFGFRFRYSEEPTILGTGGGIKNARRFLKDDLFFVLNGDIIIDLDLTRLVSFHKRQKAFASIVVQEGARAKKMGGLYVRGDGSIASILSKPSFPGRYRETFFTGIHLLDSRFFNMSGTGKKFCVIRKGYIPLLRQGVKIAGFCYRGTWADLGTFSSIQKVGHDLRHGRVKLSYAGYLRDFRSALSSKDVMGLDRI